MRRELWHARIACLLIVGALAASSDAAAQDRPKAEAVPPPTIGTSESGQDSDTRLAQLDRLVNSHEEIAGGQEYRIGPGDLLEITVMEAPELTRTTRVSEGGQISLPLLGAIAAAGKSPRQVESVLEDSLRQSYMKDPHVSVFVKEMQSHSVSVFGAVRRPGVFQIRGAKTLVELLSMAEGLADDAGNTAFVIHQAAGGPDAPVIETRPDTNEVERPGEPGRGSDATPSPAAGGSATGGGPWTESVDLKKLLDSDDESWNVQVFPGDRVKVTRAGVVYVMGEVRRPGGFQLKGNEKISVLQALALAEGFTRTSAKSRARIIRTDSVTGERTETPINLSKVLAGKISDPTLQPHDILFVPNSGGRSALYRGVESSLSVGTGLAIYRW